MADRIASSGTTAGTAPADAPSAGTDMQAVPDLARLAHELRTPLAAIAALSEIIRDERLGPVGVQRYLEYAADIHESTGHAMRVIAGFLEPTAPGGNLRLDVEELDPAEIVTGTVSALQPLAGRAGVCLNLEIGEAVPHLIADRRGLRQILDNLVANALRFTPPQGTVMVTMSCAAGGPLVLTVADTGDGMTADELERAQTGAVAPEPLRRRSGGSGIGLPLVRALAGGLGAEMTVESRLRHGTAVKIVFPRERIVFV
ncbi:MAG: sensor histidine kinase [Hyphomicrobiaceae bacterium]